MDVIIPSLVGDRIVPDQPLSLIKPLRMSGILSPLIRLCKINTGHTDLLTKRNSPKKDSEEKAEELLMDAEGDIAQAILNFQSKN